MSIYVQIKIHVINFCAVKVKLSCLVLKLMMVVRIFFNVGITKMARTKNIFTCHDIQNQNYLQNTVINYATPSSKHDYFNL